MEKNSYSSDPHFSWRIPTAGVDPARETSRPHVLDTTNSVADRKSECKSDSPKAVERSYKPGMRKMQHQPPSRSLPSTDDYTAADTSAPFRPPPGLTCGACTRQANNRIRPTIKGPKDNTTLSVRVQPWPILATGTTPSTDPPRCPPPPGQNHLLTRPLISASVHHGTSSAGIVTASNKIDTTNCHLKRRPSGWVPGGRRLNA